MILEIIASNLADVKAINQSKANQIELVKALDVGGLSPAISTIAMAAEQSRLPVNVMLRPQHHSFVYSTAEFESSLTHLKKIKQLNQPPNGIVFGSLTKSKQINEKQLQQIIAAKGNLELVFHRAFDELDKPLEGIKTLNKYPEVTVLLTSGTKAKAVTGVSIIQQLVQLSNTVKIMVGSGVNYQNIKLLQSETQAAAFHVGTAVRENGSVEGPILVEAIDKIKAVLVS